MTVPLNITVLTVSDTRDLASDSSGAFLVEALKEAGHRLFDRQIVVDDVYHIRAVVSTWIAHREIQVVLITGGTGFSGRDSTPEAIQPLFDKTIDGFGELFRAISFNEIRSSTIQSRAVAGIANSTVLFSLPGSTNACRTAWEDVLQDQLDSSHKPCNFVGVLKGR